MKYRIIGDIHGRTNWQDLVSPYDKNTTYIFLGDYTDPYYGYEKVTYDQMIEQIQLIINFKKEHLDNVILLSGNHDAQYWLHKSDTNRFDRIHCQQISELFESNKELFDKVVYSIGEKYLISHAGVSFDWYSQWVKLGKEHEVIGKEPLSVICDNINKLWQENKNAFTFVSCAVKLSDYYGDHKTHSPLWIRPSSLWESNIFGFKSGKIQIVGHTPYETYTDVENNGKIAVFGTIKTPATQEQIENSSYYLLDGTNICKLEVNDYENVDIILVDCLRKETACIEIDSETLEWKKILIEK